MKPGTYPSGSFAAVLFRCIMSTVTAPVFGALSGMHTAAAEESGIGNTVVEEVIDTVDATTAVADTVIKHAPVFLVRILTAGLIILAGVLAIGIGKRVIHKLTSRPGRKAEKIRKTETLRSVLISLLRYLVSVIATVAILTVFGIDVRAILAMASIGGIIVGFAMQTLIKDIIYGTLILAEGSIGVGDFVRINDMDGSIESVSLRTTVIRNYNGNVYTIPNGEIRTIANMSIAL